jgi:hypothetical protein
MRLINTKAHGIYDYLMGLMLLLSPNIFGYSNGGLSQNISIVVGISLWLTGALSTYEFSLLKYLPLKIHLYLDAIIGLFYATSPWTLHFEQTVYKPHFVFGLSIVMVSILTDRVFSHEVAGMMGKSRGKKIKAEKSKPNFSIPGLKFIYESQEEAADRSLKRQSAADKAGAI